MYFLFPDQKFLIASDITEVNILNRFSEIPLNIFYMVRLDHAVMINSSKSLRPKYKICVIAKDIGVATHMTKQRR